MPDIAVRIAAGLLAAVFAWAGLAKLLRWKRWREGLRRYRLGALESPTSVGVPTLELAVVGGLVAGFPRAAAALTLALLAGFCLAVLRARIESGDRLPCNCFGAEAQLDYRAMLLRNGLLGIPAAVILLAGADFELFGAMRLQGASDAIPVVLAALGLVLGGWMVRVMATMAGGGKR